MLIKSQPYVCLILLILKALTYIDAMHLKGEKG